MRNVDAALLPFLHSTDESERDRLLGELILERVSPIVGHALRQRLNFYVDQSGTNPDNPEAEDLFHEAVKETLNRLRELQWLWTSITALRLITPVHEKIGMRLSPISIVMGGMIRKMDGKHFP